MTCTVSTCNVICFTVIDIAVQSLPTSALILGIQPVLLFDLWQQDLPEVLRWPVSTTIRGTKA